MAEILAYQLKFPKLTKELFDEQNDLFKKVVINIRLDELQEKGAYLCRINKPSRNGTKLNFRVVRNSDEFKTELGKIISDGKLLGMEFVTGQPESE